jgi:CheY-like chemotaxis protein
MKTGAHIHPAIPCVTSDGPLYRHPITNRKRANRAALDLPNIFNYSSPTAQREKIAMKIFLSSTYKDLIRHREAAAQAIERLGQQGVRMEVFGARPDEASIACFGEIQDSDALVGIYAYRYGFIPQGQTRSITEQEFDFARTKEKPTFCFVVDEEYPWPPKLIEMGPGHGRLQEFIGQLRQKTIVDTFTTPEDLAYKVASSLGRFLLYLKVKDNLDKIPANKGVSTALGRSQVARRAARLATVIPDARLLIVNDVPDEMAHVALILRSLGMEVRVVTTTEAALEALCEDSFDAVVSDMRRGTVNDEGIRFLEKTRKSGFDVPVVFTVGQFDPALGTPPFAFGITNRVDELLNLLFDALERTRG